eukprot:s1232_g19.t1
MMRRSLQSSEFFKRRELERQTQREQKRMALGLPHTAPAALSPEEAPIFETDEFDEEMDDYHSKPARQMSPMIDPSDEAAEREAKRLRITSKENTGTEVPDEHSGMFSFYAEERPKFLWKKARDTYQQHSSFYGREMVSEDVFMFGAKRNDFSQRYRQLNESAFQANAPHMKKKARKEIRLNEITKELQEKLTGSEGSDAVEGQAWVQKEACEVLSLNESM